MIRISVAMTCFLTFFITGCQKPEVPTLAPMEVSAPSKSVYTDALQDLNTLLRVYTASSDLDPNNMTYYHVKPIKDHTGVSATTEIPHNITTLVRDAIAQVYHNVRYVEMYDYEDQTHLNVENALNNSGRIRALVSGQERPVANYTITGAISTFDRNLQSTSDEKKGSIAFGQGSGNTQADASMKESSSFSRLGVSFHVYEPNGVSLPGKFGGEIDLWLAKNSKDFGFAISGTGIGYAAEAVAMHGRHMALKMLTEFSVVQIIGNTRSVPYWRIGGEKKIFQEDIHVLKAWRDYYNYLNSNPNNKTQLIAFMQAQCIANGDESVTINGILDSSTKQSFINFAQKYHVSARGVSYELFEALERNRLLDVDLADETWRKYKNFEKYGVVENSSQYSSPASSAPSTPQTKSKKASPKPAAPAPSSPDYDSALEGLL